MLEQREKLDTALREGRSGFQRFHVETHAAPARRQQPRPFNPRIGKTGLAKFLIRETFHYGLKLGRKEYRRALLSRPCIYGVFSGRFGGFHPIKDRCTGCLRCVQEFPSFCRVDRNPEFYKFADSYWVPDDPSTATFSQSPVATVWYEASTGKIPVKGMGYKGSFGGRGWDSIWTDMSEIVRPTRDGVYGREYISTLVDVGRKPKFLSFGQTGKASRTLEISMPIIFDYLPPGLNNPYILNSIGATAKRTGSLFIASPDQAGQLAQDYWDRMVPLLSSSDYAKNRDLILEAPAVELRTPDLGLLQKVREINPKVPVSVRLPLAERVDDTAAELTREDVDIIHVYANYHGRGWEQDNPLFVKDLLRSVHGRLVKESLRDEVTVIASGGIILAEHVPKAIICGADLVALDTTPLVALQMEFLGDCKSQNDGRIRPEKLDVKWGEQRLVNLIASWHDQLIEILSAMGMRDVRRLRGDVGRAMFQEEIEKEAFADIVHRA